MGKKLILFLAALTILLYCGGASAVEPYRWDLGIFTTNENYYDDPTANFYFLLSGDNGNARFEFHNESPFDSSLTTIFFDGDALTNVLQIDHSLGVSYSESSSPKNFPAGNTLVPPFNTTISVEPDPPVSQNGLDSPIEWVALVMQMKGGLDIADIQNKLSNKSLRVGVHIQSLPDESSESAINIPQLPPDVPEPATLILAVLGGLGLFARKRR